MSRTDEPGPAATPASTPTAVVTGASSGIGAATARRLAAEGYRVCCVARREERVRALADEIGGTALRCDVTSAADVAALADAVGPRLDVLVNNAGGAIGAEFVADADADDWRAMYEVNVIGLLQVTQALLPALIASGAGTIVNVGSTAGRIAYEGGAGYTAAKHGTQVVTETLRLELYDQPVRVCEIAPGMVRTDEFSLKRFAGDQAKADKIYEGVAEPLVAEDVADAIGWVVTRPAHVNVDELVIRPRAQAAQHKVHRVLPG
jgi:NADP-dependent 3-hydroxy acid dehydrogenase YdfG